MLLLGRHVIFASHFFLTDVHAQLKYHTDPLMYAMSLLCHPATSAALKYLDSVDQDELTRTVISHYFETHCLIALSTVQDHPSDLPNNVQELPCGRDDHHPYHQYQMKHPWHCLDVAPSHEHPSALRLNLLRPLQFHPH